MVPTISSCRSTDADAIRERPPTPDQGSPMPVQGRWSGSYAGQGMPHRLSGTLNVPRQLSPDGNLTSVDVYISSQCNRRCTYCFLPSDFFSSGVRMSLDSFSGVVSWGWRHGVREVTLLGGEPSLHPSFVEMVSLAARQEMEVRVVTNGARRFRRLLAEEAIGPFNLARVAVSLDSLDASIQDRFRGVGAWQDAMSAISMLRSHGVLFDINVTAVRPVLGGLGELISFAEQAGCRRVNIHWPSTIGLGAGLSTDEIPERGEWASIVRMVAARRESRPDFFVEIERGYLASGESLTRCALTDFSNLQILPDGRAYRCGLLVDQDEMSSLTMADDQLSISQPEYGEELLRSTMPHSCGGCPVMHADERRACIYDKISSAAGS